MDDDREADEEDEEFPHQVLSLSLQLPARTHVQNLGSAKLFVYSLKLQESLEVKMPRGRGAKRASTRSGVTPPPPKKQAKAQNPTGDALP